MILYFCYGKTNVSCIFMKAISIFIFILCTLLSYGQVVKLKIFDINEKHPIIESHNPYPELLILDKNKDSCKYLYENGEYSIFIHNQKPIENNEIIIYFPFSFIKIKIKYDDAISDTIKLNPLFLISNDMAMKDKWFKYDDSGITKKYLKKNLLNTIKILHIIASDITKVKNTEEIDLLILSF